MSLRLDFETRKVQKYVKCKEIDVWGGQNHVLSYFMRNIRFRWPILHQSWVQISYDGLENNMNDSPVKKLDFNTRKVQKYIKCKEIDLWGGQNHVLCYFIRNIGLRWPILQQFPCIWHIFAPFWCQNQALLTRELFKLFPA